MFLLSLLNLFWKLRLRQKFYIFLWNLLIKSYLMIIRDKFDKICVIVFWRMKTFIQWSFLFIPFSSRTLEKKALSNNCVAIRLMTALTRTVFRISGCVSITCKIKTRFSSLPLKIHQNSVTKRVRQLPIPVSHCCFCFRFR